MVWNKSEYGGVEDIRLPPARLWKPDVLMYNRWVQPREERELCGIYTRASNFSFQFLKNAFSLYINCYCLQSL